MTGPFGPELRPPLLFVLIAIPAVAVAMPFLRRDDWIGWLAFLVLLTATVGFWTILIWGFTQQVIGWWRKRSKSDRG